MSAEAFIDRYWQKRPLLIRGAFPGFVSPLSADELAGLACEPEIESRVVLEQGPRGPWELQRGPFAEDHFQQLPPERWTLLVQDVEKHVPALADLLEPFRFIPDWRIDDLMISFAAPGGSVGPHVDQYDVFLLQAEGRRRWRIQYPPPATEALLPGLELRILAEFETTEEWLLEPGDMLYLPPGVPHFGVAEDACMTYSIGFRAPSHRELAFGVVDQLLDSLNPVGRYGDPGRRPQANPGEVSAENLRELRDIVRRQLSGDDSQLDRWIARFLSEPKPGFAGKPEPRRQSGAALARRFRKGLPLRRNPASRFAFVRTGGQAYLYVDGEEFPLIPALERFGERLCAQTLLLEPEPEALGTAALDLLADLYARGHWLLER